MLAEDVKENPGTLALAASWLVLFALLELVEWQHRTTPLPWAELIAGRRPPPGSGPWFEPIPISTATGHRFGDLTWDEVRKGEVWRLLTATFVHFGLIHVALNVLFLINLGRLIEPWYKTGPFLAVCLAIGAFGNLVGVFLRVQVAGSRPWLDSTSIGQRFPRVLDYFLHNGPAVAGVVHSGGGSTILLGLLALAAVVGARSKTRDGSFLQKQLLIVLALTFALGLALPNLVDNFGHLGGAIVGAFVGLLDRPLVRLADSRGFRRACWGVVSVASIGCLGLLIWDDRREAAVDRAIRALDPVRLRDEALIGDLERILGLYAREVIHADRSGRPMNEVDAFAVRELLGRVPSASWNAKPSPEERARDRVELGEALDRLDRAPAGAWGEPARLGLESVRALGQDALDRPPAFDQVYRFVVDWRDAHRAILEDRDRITAEETGLIRERQRVR